jgi:tRNA threonylcarbamoyladenosine biosynthesis protein TsaB
MNVLALDTCFAACSVALRFEHPERDVVMVTRHEPRETGHAERIAPMLQEAIAASGRGLDAIDRIAVTYGPGTFTGVRTGLAFARGLQLALGRPLVGASSLRIMAIAARHELAIPATPDTAVAAVVDARRGGVYVEVLDALGATLAGPALLPLTAAAELARGRPLVAVGSGAALLADAAAALGRNIRAALPTLQPSAETLATIAAALPPSTAALAPLYLRQPDAKPQPRPAAAPAEPWHGA